MKRDLAIAAFGVLITYAIGHAVLVFAHFGVVSIPNQESAGFIVNVQRQGRWLPTYDLWLLHGTTVAWESESERFSLGPELAHQAQTFVDSGERAKILYTTLSFADCYVRLFTQVNDCDVVTAISPLK